MTQSNLLKRTLMAAALATVAATASAASLDVSVNAATQAVTDTALTGSVKTKLATDARVKGSDISVNSENGVVVLTGTAPSAEAKAAAEDLAKSANGAVKVENRIKAPGVLSTLAADTKAVGAELKADTKAAANTTGEVVTDGWITTKVKSQLLADTLTKGTAIKVNTKGNVVALRGTVASQAEKDQAIKLASETQGVTKVDASKLKVSTKVKAKADVSAN